MEFKLKQRVIGGVVLVFLAVVFLPLLFKEPTTVPKKEITFPGSIPSEPAQPTAKDITAVESRALGSSKQTVFTTDQPAPQRKNPNQLAFGNPPLHLMDDHPAPLAGSPAKKSKSLPALTMSEDLPRTFGSSSKPAPRAKKHTAQPAEKASQRKKYAADSSSGKPSVASAWVVQLGSFGDMQRAKLLVKQLRAHGYRAYARQVKISQGKSKPSMAMMRVFVGPEAKRSKADALQIELSKKLKLVGVVVSHSPLQNK